METIRKSIRELVLITIIVASGIQACEGKSGIQLRTTIDLNINDTLLVRLFNGKTVQVTLVSIKDSVDKLTGAVRQATARVLVDKTEILINVANYNLPVPVGNVQIDCPVTKAYLRNSQNRWGLEKDARLRLWPKGSPYLEPDSFVYPVLQRFLANESQMCNEPVYVNGGETPGQKLIYYHAGLDFGGSEERDEIISTVDGIVITAGNDSLDGYTDKPEGPAYDAVYIVDKQGWFHGYFHLFSIDPGIRPGSKVRKGQRIGLLGKEGASGGWAHLHYEIQCKQPSGKYGHEDAYLYVWEAYIRQYKPRLIAVSRPHIFTSTEAKIILDGSRSKSFKGTIANYSWIFSDNSASNGNVLQERVYHQPGRYSEILKVIDSRGHVDFDFTVVQVIDEYNQEKLPPAIHAVYYPTLGIKPGDTVIFSVRTFGTTVGHEVWNFGDYTRKATVTSEVPPKAREGKYAEIEHVYKNPGHYIVRVERANEYGYKAMATLHIEVERKHEKK